MDTNHGIHQENSIHLACHLIGLGHSLADYGHHDYSFWLILDGINHCSHFWAQSYFGMPNIACRFWGLLVIMVHYVFFDFYTPTPPISFQTIYTCNLATSWKYLSLSLCHPLSHWNVVQMMTDFFGGSAGNFFYFLFISYLLFKFCF